jgi:hypothetical protein
VTIKIAIIAARNVGRWLGAAWHNRRHDATFGVRTPLSTGARACKAMNQIGVRRGLGTDFGFGLLRGRV